MRVQVQTLRLDGEGQFDDRGLRELSDRHEILAVRDHFFEFGCSPRLACVVEYGERAETRVVSEPAEAPTPSRNGKREAKTERPDPTAGLSERDRAVFDELRRWRAKKAHDEGVPAS